MDETEKRFLEWRHIFVDFGDKPCRVCGGSGIKNYGDTSTWRRGGIAGQAVTAGVCDQCWGSGNADKPWTNLREIDGIVRAAKAKAVDKEG